MKNKIFVALDLETTGNGVDDEVVEVGMTKFNTDYIIETESFLVKANKRISEEARRVNELDDKILRYGYEHDVAARKIKEFTRDSIIYSHRFLFEGFFLCKIKAHHKGGLIMDNYLLAKYVLNMTEPFHFFDVLNLLEIPAYGRLHRAHVDSYMLAKAGMKLFDKVTNDLKLTFKDLEEMRFCIPVEESAKLYPLRMDAYPFS